MDALKNANEHALGDALLEVSGLSVRYNGQDSGDRDGCDGDGRNSGGRDNGGRDSGGRPALHSASFTLSKGDTLGIIGESGSGKTTMALAVSGLLDEAAAEVSGKVVFEGRDMLKLSESELCEVRGGGIGLVFQDPKASLDPCMKVDAQVAETIRLHEKPGRSESFRLARKQLAAVGIDGEVLEHSAFAHQLSGGLAQRAMIAAALACTPRLLIADEPTSSLDVTTQAEIVQLLSGLQEETGMAMIFISHDLALVSMVAERIMVLCNGEVVEHGEKAQVLYQPAHSYTRSIIQSWERSRVYSGADLAPA